MMLLNHPQLRVSILTQLKFMPPLRTLKLDIAELIPASRDVDGVISNKS